jgi:hypothetical protein
LKPWLQHKYPDTFEEFSAFYDRLERESFDVARDITDWDVLDRESYLM